MTIFATNGNARTFDYEVRNRSVNLARFCGSGTHRLPLLEQAGDVGFVPQSFGRSYLALIEFAIDELSCRPPRREHRE